MEIRVLGSLEVANAGRAIDIRRPRERTLLTMLACEAGQIVSTARLIEGLWGDTPPATATKTLQTYVHHLRSLLPEEAIVTGANGYRLAVPPEAVDIFRFLSAVRQAREASAPEEAADLLTAALGLWRGSPLADAEDVGWVLPLMTRLSDEWLQARSDLIELQIELGRHEEALPELHSLLEEHYLREDLWRLLMLALYRSGRQAEALRAFSEARRRLVDELGIEPGPQLQRLEQEILTHDPSLLPGPTQPTPSAESPLVEPADHPMEPPPGTEQRLVILLRAELVGVEALTEVVGAASSSRTGSEAVGAMKQTISRFGGMILEEREGEGVLALFGAPVAREDDTYRAIRAAMGLTVEIAEHSQEIDRSWGFGGVAARTAIHTTHMVLPVGESSQSLETEGLMAGLLSLGEPGSVIVDDHTRRLMEGLFEWGPVSSADAEGWQVEAVLLGADKARMGGRLHAPFQGRDQELATATRELVSLRRGIGGILLISGEAGVGKTRLVDEMRLHDPDVTWLAGHGASYAEATPYWPFRDLFRFWLGVGIDDTDLQVRVALHQRLDDSLSGRADELYPYLGGLLGITLEPDQAQRLQLASEALQYRTFGVVSDTLEGLAERAPTVVVLEDLHWADATSLQLLDQLLSLVERSALLFVLTTRPEPDHPSRRMAERARQLYPHRLTEIVLGGLHEDAQRSMLHSLVGPDTLPPPVADRILRLAEGNPFYLEELVGSLIDQGALVPSASGWELYDVDLTVPETVEKVVQARIDSLKRRSRDLLTAASILGRSFGLPLLQGVVGEAGAPVEVIQDLLRLDLLVEARRWPQAEYLFRHALIQETAYRTLSEERRIELHRRAAGWLERRYEHNEDEVMELLARHWRAAGDDDKAVSALMRAGDLARKDHALDEAIGHYRVLLSLLDRRGDRRTMALVLLKLALALHNSLRFAESNEVYQRAFELWEPGPSPEPTATLRYGGPPFTLVPDPIRSFTLPDIQLQMALFDRLVERWPDDTLVPSLAESWKISDDGLEYRFVLQEGLTWSDGKPLTAHDVEFGIKRNLDPTRPGIGVAMFYVLEGALDQVRGRNPERIGVEALDDRTVVFRLVNPAPYFLAMLNRPDAGPQPRHAIEARGEAWGDSQNEVVSGAFRRRDQSDDGVILERRPGYHGWRHGNVKVVEWRHGDPAETMSAYTAGEVDMGWISGLFDGEGLERIPGEQVWPEPPAALVFVAFVFGRPLPDDQRLRLALAHCIDRELLDSVMPSHATAATGGVVPPMLAGHTPDIAPRFDPELSRQLLSSVDLSAPLRVVSPVRPHLYVGRVMETMVATWREHLGLAIELLEPDLTGYAEILGDPSGVDLIPATWYPGYTDPEYYLRLLLHSDASANYGGFASGPYDRLVEKACAAGDERTRLALFHDADRMAVAEQAAVLTVSYDRNLSLRRPTVEGWWEFGKSWANFADLTVTES